MHSTDIGQQASENQNKPTKNGLPLADQLPYSTSGFHKSATVLALSALLVVFLVAAFLRTYHLESVPPGLSPDVAANGIDAIEILQGKLSPFLERNGGREPLHMYLIALVFSTLGVSGWAILFTSALVGIATVLAAYLLARTMFNSELVAIAASGWLAISYWHVNFSRSGLRATTLPLITSLALYFVWKGLFRRNGGISIPWLALGGFFLGLSLYTYLPARFFPLVIAVFLGIVFYRQWRARKRGRPEPIVVAGTMGIFCLVAFLPLGLFFIMNPGSFTGRASEVSIFNETYNHGNALLAWLDGLSHTTGMFFVSGDGNWRHNYDHRPIFDPLTSILFLVGVIIVLKRVQKPEYLITVIWLCVMLLPATLTAEGMPNSLRAMGLLPVVYFIPALGVNWLREVSFTSRIGSWAFCSFFAILFFVGAFTTYQAYFDLWGSSQNARDAVEAEFTPIAQGLNEAAKPDVPIIIPVSNALRPGYRHFTLDFLYKGNVPLAFLQVDDATTVQDLNQRVSGSGKVTLLEWYDTYLVDADPRGVLNFMLEMNGRKIEEKSFKGFKLTTYELTGKPAFFLGPENVTWRNEALGEGKSLEGFAFGRSPRSDETGVWMTVYWGSGGDTAKNLKSSLRLQDSEGKTIVQKDNLLLDNSHRYTSAWDPGSRVMDHAYLAPPYPLPDGTYRLAVVLYDPVSMQQVGQQIVLGSISLSGNG